MGAPGAFRSPQQMPRLVCCASGFFLPASFPLSTHITLCTPAVPEATIKDLSDQLATLKGTIPFPVCFRLFDLPVYFC